MAITNTPNEVVHQAYKSEKRSWFAMKHTNLSSYQPGYEHPDLVVPLTGNTTVKLNMSRYLQSAPTATPLFDSMRVNFRVFFAPQRLYTRGLYGNNYEEIDKIESVELPIFNLDDRVPTGDVDYGHIIPRGSLLHRLGYPASLISGKSTTDDDSDALGLALVPLNPRHRYNTVDSVNITPMQYANRCELSTLNLTPIVAYYDICNHYIANPYVDDVPFLGTQMVRYNGDTDSYRIEPYLESSEYIFVPRQSLVNAVQGVKGVVSSGTGEIFAPYEYILDVTSSEEYTNGIWQFGGVVPLTIEHYASEGFDSLANLCDQISPIGMYPTNFGEHYQTMFYDEDEIDSLQYDTEFVNNIQSIRIGQSVWNKTLRTILRGRKYTDWIDVQFGSKLKLSDHPIFVGSDSMLVSFQDAINQSAQGDVPLGKAGGVGARGGKGADAERTIVFTAQEPGYLMVLVDFVPEVSYADVLPRWIEYRNMSSFPMPAYSGREFQDLKGSDLVYSGSELDNFPIGKQPLFFDYMSSYNRLGGLFSSRLFESYTFKRDFDLTQLYVQSGSLIDRYLRSTYVYPGMFDYQFEDVGQNGRQNFWMKTEYNLRLYQPLEKQVVTGRI